MLRNRSRAMTSKQALMANQTSFLSPTKNNPSTPISSFLNSPRFFNELSPKNLSDSEITLMSPISILDTKNLPTSQTPFPEIINQSEPQAIGLALIDSLNQEKSDGNFSKPINRVSLFGSKLKVQIPANNPPCLISPVESPVDFGIKTRNSQFLSLSPTKGNLTRQLSLKEMELSEDYTCVITHGANPKTTHIFHDCIIKSCCGEDSQISSSVDFLSFCNTCKDNFEQGKDNCLHRGETAFCSYKCRCQEISVLEGHT